MLKKVGMFFKNSFIAILKGEFILRLGVGRYFLQILYVFFLLAVIIWLSLMTDKTMNRVEDNKTEIHRLEITYTMKKYDLERCNDRRVVSERLKDLGSDLAEPTVPATKLVDD